MKTSGEKNSAMAHKQRLRTSDETFLGASHPLEGQTVMVVGGSSGIGSAVAQRAASHGASVVIVSRQASRFDDGEPSSKRIRYHHMDITQEADRKSLAKRSETIDHLVFAVRSAGSSAPFLQTTQEQAKEAFEVKFWGVYSFIQAIYPCMAAQSSITLTSGITGEKIIPGASSMAAINSATETLCRQLAVELAPIRINAVSPGFVAPKPEPLERRARDFPQRRLASPNDVAPAYIELMMSSYRTGTIVVVDGGARLV
tara:strand:+ start:21236 stop:22006 length:771 start_codon:yes stop_codon:yes gene_type:complete